MANDQFDEVVIQGTTYLVPKADANPPYGEELNDYLKALGNAYSTLVGVGDIAETTATLGNNVSSASDVEGLTFDSVLIRSADIAYQITRTTSTTTEIESGHLGIFYNPTFAVNSKWTIQRDGLGASGIEFSITDAGQVQYTSTNLSGTSYSGVIKYEARALLQS